MDVPLLYGTASHCNALMSNIERSRSSSLSHCSLPLAFRCRKLPSVPPQPQHPDKFYCSLCCGLRVFCSKRFENERHRRRTICSCSFGKTNEIMMVELPCLPFSPAEVFTPSASKTLHLYEARFLALLDEDGILAVVMPSLHLPQHTVASHKSKVKLEVGALVTVRGIGRIEFLEATQVEPFIKGKVKPLQDDIPEDTERLSSMMARLKCILKDVQQLQIKLKTPSNDLLQTPLEKALQWAEKNNEDHDLKPFVPRREELISFAALQPVAGAGAGELHKLLQERLLAMELTDTLQRLKNVSMLAEENRASIAAKIAIQSLQF